MNQCDTLYLTCHNCALLLRDDNDINAFDTLKQQVNVLKEELKSEESENGKLSQQVKTLEDHQKSLQNLLEERENTLLETETKLVNLEQNATGSSTPPTGDIEDLITKRFDKIDQNITLS